MRKLLLPFLLVALSACDSTSEPTIGGVYSFSEAADESSFGLRTEAVLTIPDTESGERFSYSYTFRQIDRTSGATVTDDSGTGTGTYDHPGITFRVAGETATGTVSDDGGRIEIDEAGFIYVRSRPG